MVESQQVVYCLLMRVAAGCAHVRAVEATWGDYWILEANSLCGLQAPQSLFREREPDRETYAGGTRTHTSCSPVR
jgi:hypothetical protein